MATINFISIVIPNFNGRHLLQDNIPSVICAAQTTGLEFEIIVADDASTDDSVAWLRATYPEIICLPTQTNGGFSTNINRGVRIAKGDVVLLLNSDVKLTPDYLLPLLKYFSASDTFGVIGQLIDPESGAIKGGAKYPKIDLTTIWGTANYWPTEETDENVWLPSFFLSGDSALVSREKLLTLGGFDESFSPFYGEDLDLGIRAWRMGWKCYFEPDALFYHKTASTISTVHKQTYTKPIIRRNKILLHYIHLQGARRYLWFLHEMLRLIVKSITFDMYYVKGLADFLRRFPKARHSRQAFSQLCRQNKNGACLSIGQTKKRILSIIDKQAIRRD